MTPSKGCGPYRVYESMYDVVGYAVFAARPGFSLFIQFLLSPGFVAPLIVFLWYVIFCLFIQLLLDYVSMANNCLAQNFARHFEDIFHIAHAEPQAAVEIIISLTPPSSLSKHTHALLFIFL